MNEYLKVVDENGKMPGDAPYLKGEKFGLTKYSEYIAKLAANNKILYDIHTHPNDYGFSIDDYETFLKYGEFWGNPQIKLIAVGPKEVIMYSGWSSNWTDSAWKPVFSKWSLDMHHYRPF